MKEAGVDVGNNVALEVKAARDVDVSAAGLDVNTAGVDVVTVIVWDV